MSYWFFLSYTRSDNVGAYVGKFFEELAKEVRRIAGERVAVKPREIGFLDERGIEVGDTWDDRLIDALQSCRTFVGLYSKGYFRSRVSGKEFEVFRRRVDEYHRSHPALRKPPPVIFPVLWGSEADLPRQLPAVLGKVQYKHADFGASYAALGLYTLMNKQQHSGDYFDLKVALARRIVEVGEQFMDLSPLAGRPSLDSVNNAFEAMAAPSGRAVGGQADGGPRVAKFVFFAGARQDYTVVGRDSESYGLRLSQQWRPFLPNDKRSVGTFSDEAAMKENLECDFIDVDEGLLQKIGEAERQNQIVLIIVDPWSVRLGKLKTPMGQYDERQFLNCGLLIPWNPADAPETAQLHEELKGVLRRTFRINRNYRNDAIRSPEKFQEELSTAINSVRKQIMNEAADVRQVASTDSKSLPTISTAAPGVGGSAG